MTYRVFNLGGVPGNTGGFALFVDNYGLAAGYSAFASLPQYISFFGDNKFISTFPQYDSTQTNSYVTCGNKVFSIYGGAITYFNSTLGHITTDPIINNNGTYTNVRAGGGFTTEYVSAISPNSDNYTIQLDNVIDVPNEGQPNIFNTSAWKYKFGPGLISLQPLGTDNKLLAMCIDDFGNAYGSSNNGANINTTHACAWLTDDGIGTLYSPFGTDTNAYITCCSSDGLVIAGSSYNNADYIHKGVIWTGGEVLNIAAPAGYTEVNFMDMSSDAKFLCGKVSGPLGIAAFVYESGAGFTILPGIDGELANGNNIALRISDDGLYVSGYVQIAGSNSYTPILWVGERLNNVMQIQIPEPIAMPCYTPCLGKGSIITKV